MGFGEHKHRKYATSERNIADKCLAHVLVIVAWFIFVRRLLCFIDIL